MKEGLLSIKNSITRWKAPVEGTRKKAAFINEAFEDEFYIAKLLDKYSK